MQQPTAPLEQLLGSIERVTFHNEETGFCVLRIKVKGRRDLVTVVANAASVTAGESIECSGSWVNDKIHGMQFQAMGLKVIQPNTLEGMEKYLCSGVIKGIGPYTAKQLIQAFGKVVFDVIENHPRRLLKLQGMGEKRLAYIVNAWKVQKSIREIMVFLQSHGIGVSRAIKIYKTYGKHAIDRVRENPYRLASDIHGMGFKTADTLAIKLGIARDSLIRAQAGIHHVLQELSQSGHCAAQYDMLLKSSESILEISEATIQQAIAAETAAKNLIADDIDDKSCIYLKKFYQAEVATAQYLLRLKQDKLPWGIIDTDKAIPWVESQTRLQLASSQKDAIRSVIQNKVSIITGGPGVGKTTIIHSILRIISAKRMRIELCAPTGRAAKRLSESTGRCAKTIHRLLEYEPQSFLFKYNQGNPLPVDFLIIDEASMVDVNLMHQILRAVPSHASLLLVGDVDQLPSVGPGNVLADIINSNVIATVRLTEIFRQVANSKIVINSHRINQGQMPYSQDKKEPGDFYILYADTPEDIYNKLIPIVTRHIPRYMQCDPVRDIQVLTPMNLGSLGTKSLNFGLQAALNATAEPKITRYGWTFAPGDKVIQIINNYEKEVFNGDIGTIRDIDLEESVLHIQFDERVVKYDFSELDEINLAYAISIHKSQGSEYPVIVIPLATQHYNLLARNLLYTGVTRGKKLVVLIGQRKAIGMAVKNNRANQRLTKLAQRLADLSRAHAVISNDDS
jgi:exodeoxyribonuclease V alpha subunit